MAFFEHKTTGIIHATIVKLSFPEVGHDIMQVVKEDELSFGHVTARIHARLGQPVQQNISKVGDTEVLKFEKEEGIRVKSQNRSMDYTSMSLV